MYEKYHDGRFRYRNGTGKKICYSKGDSCKFATNERCGDQLKVST